MNLEWSQRAWKDYQAWHRTDSRLAQKINDLVKDIQRSPFSGLGKPEPLKAELAGWWSRRITTEHRLIYRVTGKGQNQKLEILQCRLHY